MKNDQSVSFEKLSSKIPILKNAEQTGNWEPWIFSFQTQDRLQAFADVWNNEIISEDSAAKLFLKIWEKTPFWYSQNRIAERMFREFGSTQVFKDTLSRISVDDGAKFPVWRGMSKLEYEWNIFHKKNLLKFAKRDICKMGFSWTVKHSTATQYASKFSESVVMMRWASKSDLLCFIEKDGENEVIVRRSAIDEWCTNAD